MYVTLAASGWFQTPNTPHSSWNRSSSRHVTLKSAPPRALDPVQRDIHDRLRPEPEHQPVAARRADPAPRDRRLRHQRLELAHPRGLHGNHHARRPLAEEHLVATAGRIERRLQAPELPAGHA